MKIFFQKLLVHLFAVLLVLAAAGCQSLSTPPRMATATALALLPPTATPEPLVLAAPADQSPLIETEPITTNSDPNPSLTVWVNETSPAHEAVLDQMAADFSQTYQIDLELVLVSPPLLPKLMETAVLSDSFDLPDIVLHPVEYTMGWAEQGILDTAVTNEIIDEIGRDTFNPEALDLVTQDGQAAAIPNDGYSQLIIYRADWAQELGLAPPDNYEAMLTMAETISSTIGLSGFVVPTESNLVTTHQVFEQIALANGCQLIDEKGEVLILEPACQEALDFYFDIVHNYSPIGVQTDTSARNAYLAGRTGLIMSSPAVLPRLAGLDTAVLPTCRQCTADPGFLAQNSGILTQITGSRALAQPSNLSEITYLGIVDGADRETAVTFTRYWFNEAYPNWLAVESERKVPMRWGTAEQPRQFIDAWGSQPLAADGPSLKDLYGDDAVTQLRDSVLPADRWGLLQGQGQLVTTLYEDLTISVTLQEMLSGYFDTAQTLREAYAKIIDFIPNYAYDRETVE